MNKESQGQMLALNLPSPSFCLRCHCLSPGQNLSLCLFWKMSSACLNVKKWDILSCLLPSLGFTQGAQPVNCMLEKNALAFEAVTLFFSHLHSCNKDFSLPSLPGLSSNGDFRWSKRSERKPTLKGWEIFFTAKCTLKWAEQRDVQGCFSEEQAQSASGEICQVLLVSQEWLWFIQIYFRFPMKCQKTLKDILD